MSMPRCAAAGGTSIMKQHAAAPPRHQGLSGRERPELKLVRPAPADHAANGSPFSSFGGDKARSDLHFQQELFAQIAHELPPLFARHYDEISAQDFPLEPDWDRYYRLEIEGALKILTARAGGILVGYIFNIIGPHLHYRSALYADLEMWWLDPGYRGGYWPVKWFKANDAMLKSFGVKKVMAATKNHFMEGRVGSIFRRLGYKPVETVWTRRI